MNGDIRLVMIQEPGKREVQLFGFRLTPRAELVALHQHPAGAMAHEMANPADRNRGKPRLGKGMVHSRGEVIHGVHKGPVEIEE